jgi:plastocyanin
MIEDLVTKLMELSAWLVTPDWGALVALIPVLLAIAALLILARTAFGFLAAGPTRRGVRRQVPVAPPGVRLAGPSVVPFIGVVGVFGLLFLAFAGSAIIPPNLLQVVAVETQGPPATVGAPDARLVAKDLAFDTATLEVPAGTRFRLQLDNQDSVPHNVAIKDAGGNLLFTGATFSGPGITVYDVPALAAGQYLFVCTVHPAMTGTITAR